MSKYKPPASTLLFGGPGVGKTALAVSSFWNWRARESVANGKLITFGAEDNPALYVPEECRQTTKGTSLRLTSPLLDSNDFLKQFDLVTRRLILDAQEGHGLDVLVVDGLSEFDLLFEETFVGGGDGDSGRYAKWDALLSQMFSLMMRLTPSVLGCHVIMTARVMEKKKARQTKTATMAGDPGYFNFDYYPSMRGAFRLHMPHYFNLVLYMETQQVRPTSGRFAGKVVPAHIVNMVRNGEFYLKNCWEHEWLAAEDNSRVVNPMWPELWARITRAVNEYAPGVDRDDSGDGELIVE